MKALNLLTIISLSLVSILLASSTSTSTSSTSSTTSCGNGVRGNGKCQTGLCCSKYGWCVANTTHCAENQGRAHGQGVGVAQAPPCGEGNRGNGRCLNGLCCSPFGWCGSTPHHCRNSTTHTPTSAPTSAPTAAPTTAPTTEAPVEEDCEEDPVIPKNIGIILFSAFDTLDIYGPLEGLHFASLKGSQLNVFYIAQEKKMISSKILVPGVNKFNSSVDVHIMPTHTFSQPPAELDTLLIPGGPGVRSTTAEVLAAEAFIRENFPKMKVVICICTGVGLAARAGALDGYFATTNKASWKLMTSYSHKVKWVSPARWVVDGKVWTSSGVSSGLDLMAEFMKVTWGEDMANSVNDIMEYVPHPQTYDPFAQKHNLTGPYLLSDVAHKPKPACSLV